jgi:predicted RNA-binding Zn ribbon-like protein
MPDHGAAVEVVLRFVNTHADAAGHPEVFAKAEGFTRWAVDLGLLKPDAVVTNSDAASAREFRDALITVMLSHANDPAIDDADIADAEKYFLQAAARYPLTSVITVQGARLGAESTGVPGVLGNVLAAVTEVAGDGRWTRIKACCNPPCHTGFIDRTRNKGARFCSPGCGSQVSMRALRERRRQSGL